MRCAEPQGGSGTVDGDEGEDIIAVLGVQSYRHPISFPGAWDLPAWDLEVPLLW